MSKKKLSKMTKDTLLARAAALKDKPSAQYKEYESNLLGEAIVVKKLPIRRVCEIMDMATEDTSAAALELNKQLIYESVPLFKEKDVQDAFECSEPYDIVVKVFEENMGELAQLAAFILGLYGLKDAVDDLKN